MRSVLVLSFAACLAGFALDGCGGARPAANRPAAVASSPAPRSLVDPAVPSRPPPRPRPAARPLLGRMPLLPPLTAVPGVPASETPWVVDTVVVGRDDRSGLDRTLRLPTGLELSNKKSDFWSPCVRDFVLLEPEAARDALGEALSLYSTTCTSGPARRVEFQTPRADRTAPAQSHLGVIGALEPTRYELALRAAYHGPPVRAERIALIADEFRWSSPQIAFDDDDGWQIATLPLTRELARVVRRIAEARDAVVRFEGDRDYEDVVLSEDMKQDLRVMLDALDAIHRP